MDKIDRAPSGHRCGQSHYKAKFSDEIVRKIRSEYLPYVRSYEVLARKYGCGISTIRDICTYRTRKNII